MWNVGWKDINETYMCVKFQVYLDRHNPLTNGLQSLVVLKEITILGFQFNREQELDDS